MLKTFAKIAVLLFFIALIAIFWEFGNIIWLSLQTKNWHTAFDICVKWMEQNCHRFGMDYKEFNIFLFVILHPIITLLSIGLNIYFIFKRIKK